MILYSGPDIILLMKEPHFIDGATEALRGNLLQVTQAGSGSAPVSAGGLFPELASQLV